MLGVLIMTDIAWLMSAVYIHCFMRSESESISNKYLPKFVILKKTSKTYEKKDYGYTNFTQPD